MLNQLLRPIVRTLARNGTRSASSEVVHVKLPTINDIPQHCGSWRDHHEKMQKVYNAQLIIGATVLISTLSFIKISGIIFFNFGPPEEPVEEKK